MRTTELEELGKEPRPLGGASRAPLRSIGPTVVILAAVGAVLFMWFGPVLGNLQGLSPGQDLAWYQWRAELLTAHPPEVLADWRGPLGVFGGAYRVATPVLGALLRRVPAVDRVTMSVLLISGRLVLLALACGAIAYRLVRSAWAFAVVAVFAAGVFFLYPYVGYVDNGLAMLFVGASLLFLGAARTRWPARAVVFLLVFVSFFTHPPTALVFVATVLAAAGLRVLAVRPVRDALRPEIPLVLTVLAAGLAATVAWRLGVWGPAAAFSAAAHPPPLPGTRYFVTVREWITQMEPARMAPLMLLGVLWVALPGRRLVADPLRRVGILWLAPLLGVLGYFLGLRYPFHRFMNSTAAPVVLAGLGAWAAAALLLRAARGRRRRVAAGAVGAALAAAVLVSTWRGGVAVFDGRGPWLLPDLVASLESTRTYLERDSDHPVVFVVAGDPSAGDDVIWGNFKGRTNRLWTAVPGRLLPDATVFVGNVHDLRAGRPTRSGNPLSDRISRATFRDVQEVLGGRRPLVILIRHFNRRVGNQSYLHRQNAVALDRDAAVVVKPGLAAPDPGAVAAARTAGAAVREPARGDRGPGRPLRTAMGFALVLLLPGLLAARWAGVRDLPTALVAVPALSLALNVASGLLVLGVLRRPLSAGVGWAIALLASGSAVLLYAGSRGAAAASVEQEDGREQGDD